MTEPEQALLTAFELHSPEGIHAACAKGLDATAPINGKLPFAWLTEMYTRSDRFPACLRALLEYGATCPDAAVLPILLNDAQALRTALKDKPGLLTHRTDMVSAFTPLSRASLLHVAAEYGNLEVAEVLISAGADVNARTAVDDAGLNGHTPIFHTVNSNGNRSAPILQRLIRAGAACDLRLSGLIWGKGFDWETVFFDITPITYAQMGLLPQMHREEADIYANIRLMMDACHRRMPSLANVPNRYLKPGK